jgi:predicted PurR-regulated permease PerM
MDDTPDKNKRGAKGSGRKDADRRSVRPNAGGDLGAPVDFGVKTKVISIAALILILVTFWYMLNLVLLTFILTFVFYHFLAVMRKRLDGLPFRIPDGILLTLLYAVVFSLIAVIGVKLSPVIVSQLTEISKIFLNFDFNRFRMTLPPTVSELIMYVDLKPYISSLGETMAGLIAKAGVFGVNFLLAILLSFLLLMEKPKIKKLGEVMKESRIYFLYYYFMNFGRNFTNTFAKVMKVQVTIAFVNCVLSTIILFILSFPQVVGLGIMIFCLGLIPVAGMIISLIPLLIIAFNIGGVVKAVAVLAMVVILHGVEAYILNPKLMSEKISLPVCFVFLILIVAEHYLGVWGLLIGVPIFIFLLNIFEVDYRKAAASGRELRKTPGKKHIIKEL